MSEDRVWRVYCTRPSDFEQFSYLVKGSAADAKHSVSPRQKAGFIHCRYEVELARS